MCQNRLLVLQKRQVYVGDIHGIAEVHMTVGHTTTF